MTNTNQTTTIRIAEWCGWTEIRLFGGPNDARCFGLTPNGSHTLPLPNYLTDLNACAEFEGLLEERGKRDWYMAELGTILEGARQPPDDEFAAYDHEFAFATAAQRCAAMVEVIEGETAK